MSDITPSTSPETPPKHAQNTTEIPSNDNKRFQLWQVTFDFNTSTQNLADEHTLADWPPQVIKNRCLEYHYTKLGRWTYFGWWTPTWWIKHRCLEYCYTKLGRETYFGWWTPQVIMNRCLEYCYTKLGRWTYIGWYPVVWIWKDDLPPWRTSTYERPFTQEGNYLVRIFDIHVVLLTIGHFCVW